jgi:ABC-type branched-subunit amino acid transport system substrate-binding protein
MRAVGRRSTLRLVVVAAATLVASAVTAGCGGDAQSGGGTTSSKQSFTGDPVTIYVQGTLKTPVSDLSDAVAAVKLQAKKINDEGGLGGHEVVIKTCNDTDANAEMECVRKATAEKALAFVGSSFIFNPQPAQSALAKASTASVAPLAIQQVEYSSPINFPLYSPSFGILTCPQQMVQGAGSQKIGAITQDLPVQKELLKTIGGLAQVEGTPFGAGVAVPQTQTDFSSAVRQIADSGADTVVNILVPPTQPSFFAATSSVGQKFKYCGSPSSFTLPILNQIGAISGDLYVSTNLPPVGEEGADKYPLVKQFYEDMNAATEAGDKDADPKNLGAPGNALNGYLGMELINQVAADVKGELTPKSFLAAMNKATFDLAGVGGPTLDFSKPVPGPALQRLFNPVVTLYKWDTAKGEFTTTNAKPTNVLEAFGKLAKAGA